MTTLEKLSLRIAEARVSLTTQSIALCLASAGQLSLETDDPDELDKFIGGIRALTDAVGACTAHKLSCLDYAAWTFGVHPLQTIGA